MLFFGQNITSNNDPLQPVSVQKVIESIRQPKERIRLLVDRLRAVRGVDKSAYNQLKKSLPYLVCGAFKPAIRKKENFLSIGYFFIDLDHISRSDNINDIKRRLAVDPCIYVMFISPGGDGLKLLFKIQDPMKDPGLFSAFYKIFCKRFAAQYGLLDFIDSVTHDVTRACFISYDEEVYVNNTHESVDPAQFLSEDSDVIWEMAKEAALCFKQVLDDDSKEDRDDKKIEKEVMVAIRQKLNPNYKEKKEKNFYVPFEVDDFIEKVKGDLSELAVEVKDVSPIQYGRKIKLVSGYIWAEIIIFYGKHGFKFVCTTKTGSNQELGTLCVHLLDQLCNTKI